MAVVICVGLIPIVWVSLALGFGFLEKRQRQRLVLAVLHSYCRPGWADEVEAWLHGQP